MQSKFILGLDSWTQIKFMDKDIAMHVGCKGLLVKSYVHKILSQHKRKNWVALLVN